jgi:iron complex transport system permease protein
MNYRLLIAILGASTLALFVVSLLVGPAGLDVATSTSALFSEENKAAAIVMREIRLPRAILGVMIGATLGLSGAVLQGYLRNPLADPSVLGVSGAASLGAVVAIYTGASAAFALALPLFAIAGAILAVILVQVLAGRIASVLTLILAGVAINTIASAATSLILSLSTNPYASIEIIFWMLGSLTDRSMTHVGLALPFVLLGATILLYIGRDLDALSLGPEVAASMGVRLERTQTLIVIGTASAVGAATSVAGTIGFVGLVVPHLLRPLVGNQPSRLLAVSAMGGAAAILAADIAVRVIAPDRDLKLGVLTAIIGTPFFLWLILEQRRKLT